VLQEEPGGPPRRAALTSRYPATATNEAREGAAQCLLGDVRAQACPGERSGDARGGHDEREVEIDRASCAEVSGHGEQ